MLSCYLYFLSLKAIILSVLLFSLIDLNLLLGWLISDLYFYAVLLIFLLQQVFLSPYFQLHPNSYQFWGYLNPLPGLEDRHHLYHNFHSLLPK